MPRGSKRSRSALRASSPREERHAAEAGAEKQERGWLGGGGEHGIADDPNTGRGRVDAVPEEELRRIACGELCAGVRHVRQAERGGIGEDAVDETEEIEEPHV